VDRNQNRNLVSSLSSSDERWASEAEAAGSWWAGALEGGWQAGLAHGSCKRGCSADWRWHHRRDCGGDWHCGGTGHGRQVWLLLLLPQEGKAEKGKEQAAQEKRDESQQTKKPEETLLRVLVLPYTADQSGAGEHSWCSSCPTCTRDRSCVYVDVAEVHLSSWVEAGRVKAVWATEETSSSSGEGQTSGGVNEECGVGDSGHCAAKGRAVAVSVNGGVGWWQHAGLASCKGHKLSESKDLHGQRSSELDRPETKFLF